VAERAINYHANKKGSYPRDRGGGTIEVFGLTGKRKAARTAIGRKWPIFSKKRMRKEKYKHHGAGERERSACRSWSDPLKKEFLFEETVK